MQQRACTALVMSQFDDCALAFLPVKRTRAQACRIRRKHRTFQAGISRGIAVLQGPPGLQTHLAAHVIGPGLEPPDAAAEVLDEQLAVYLHSPPEPTATMPDDDEDLDDIFRFITAIQEQRWQKADLALSCESLTDGVLEQEDYIEQKGSPYPIENSLRLPRLPLLTHRDAMQISAVSTCHLSLITTQLAKDMSLDPPHVFDRTHDSGELSPDLLTSIERKALDQSIERLRMSENLGDEDVVKLHKFWQTHPWYISIPR